MTIIDQTIKDASTDMRAIFAANLAIFGFIISLALGFDLHHSQAEIGGVIRGIIALVVFAISFEIGYVAYIQGRSEDSKTGQAEQYGALAAAGLGFILFMCAMVKSNKWCYGGAALLYLVPLVIYVLAIDGKIS
tara:strand:+ start:330 stop:731 length:402 start_codon:yes stop_codon:yes gene_type:complete